MARETETMQFEHANAMPAATWHFLKMNDTTVQVPAGLAFAPDVRVDVPLRARGAADAFDQALDRAQEEWERTHPAPSAEERAARDTFLAAEADATYGGTAQSSYQAGADALEDARSLSLAFETGVSEEAAAYLRYAAGERIVVQAGPGQVVDAQVVVASVQGAFSAAAIDVVAGSDSTVNLSVVVRSRGDQSIVAQGAFAGFTGTTMRVFAGAGAHVGIVRTQALDAGFVDVDDLGLFAAERAAITVSQTVLGASKTYTGLATDLRGDASRIDIATRYLGHADQAHDFNYIVRHHGQRTECELGANGVLAGRSSKTLRGTIDLIRGAKGAQGSENETVLLVDEGVRNLTVPVILCNEDDVAGNHGATIGHIRDEQMFYLASRGLSREMAERMFVSALMEQAAIDAPDDEAREAVVRLGETVSPGFAELVE